MLEKGKQILMKDNLIDEERAKQEEAAQESLDQKLERLGKIDQQCWILISWLMHLRVQKSFMGVTWYKDYSRTLIFW